MTPTRTNTHTTRGPLPPLPPPPPPGPREGGHHHLCCALQPQGVCCNHPMHVDTHLVPLRLPLRVLCVVARSREGPTLPRRKSDAAITAASHAQVNLKQGSTVSHVFAHPAHASMDVRVATTTTPASCCQSQPSSYARLANAHPYACSPPTLNPKPQTPGVGRWASWQSQLSSEALHAHI